MTSTLLTELKHEIYDLTNRYPKLTDEDLFGLWFLFAYLVEDEAAAANALTGSPSDKDVDALVVDDRARSVFVVQTKYHKQSTASEKRSDVVTFAGLAEVLNSPKPEFDEFLRTANALVQTRLTEARGRVKRGYGIHLLYVTTGRFTASVRTQAEHEAKKAGATLDLIDYRRLERVMMDYRDGVAPPIPMAELQIETGGDTQGVVRRVDSASGIDSWVFSARGEDIGALYTKFGSRIFARNIRGFLGSGTDVNRAMEHSLATEADHFWYFNNGVTIVCNDIERRDSGIRSVLHIANPQIINGQQTTRTLSKVKHNSRASVLVRAIKLPADQFDLISRIVVATNRQNRVLASDLRSNDRVQVAIERGLRRLGYHYLRKRTTKGEARASAGSLFRFIIKKDELAQAVAACELDPELVRSAKELLFEDGNYERIFNSEDAYWYLVRYRVMSLINQQARGSAERRYAKWLVLHLVWRDIRSEVGTRPRAFVKLSQRANREDPAIRTLRRVIDTRFASVLRFFRANRGKGAEAVDVYVFFKRKGQATEYASWLKRQPAAERRKLSDPLKKFKPQFVDFAREVS